MAITSYGNTYQEAIKKSYQSIEKLHFDKMYYRKDIGFDFINKSEQKYFYPLRYCHYTF